MKHTTPSSLAAPNWLLRLLKAGAWLVLPLAGLLWLQWPMRALGLPSSRLVNDFAQLLFALYCALAVAAATVRNAHLSASPVRLERPRWHAWALLACTGPWAAWGLWVSGPTVWRSVMSAERFSETFSPGYFLIRVALLLLLALTLVLALWGVRRASRARP